ncbi:MAG: FAD-dependent pyridine nucleotide-disulfide oxidoreductase [Frankiales bacterium]|nr:FAD-dependent pyridine nucleotide-disulfide oxidoreductase [Frankiales bacterium]
MTQPQLVDVAIIGAGQAGLSAAYHLRRRGLDFVVLDGGATAGGAWQHRWPSLTLGRTHRLHDLPGLALPAFDPDVPASRVVTAYFSSYEKTFELPVRRPVRVSAVRDGGDGRLHVETDAGIWAARAVINATGTWTRPFVPHYPGIESFTGEQLHTVDFRSAQEFAGRHVVVVGGGASAVQLLLEIAAVTATTWVARRTPIWREGPFDEDAGRHAVALAAAAAAEGRALPSIVSTTGLMRTPATEAARARGVLDRRPMFARIEPRGVRWADGEEVRADVILWCTGFRPAVDHLSPLRLREAGGGIRMEGTRAARDPRLHLVGYGPSASTIGATRAGVAAVREIAQLLAAAYSAV